MSFVDICFIKLKAGNGGNGCLAWRREAHVPLGGPSGGNGGDGGSVYFVGDINENSLEHLKYKKEFIALDGENGDIKNMHGRNANDLFIKVPLGTIVINRNTNEVICDIKENKKQYLVIKGGKGGHGNAYFKSSFNKAPSLFENGEIGKTIEVKLELKEIADVGLIGFPNAGKSSLISKLTNAKPKIADYSFTTLVPILGTLENYDKSKIVIADIPGLIENASSGYGLGFEFLRHIERCKILVHLISLSELDNEDIVNSYKTIVDELKKYNIKLLDKKIIVIANKNDLENSGKQLKKLEKFLNIKVLSISCFNDDSVKKVKDLLLKEFNELKSENDFEEIIEWEDNIQKEELLDENITIVQLEENVWDVKGEYLEYWANRIPLKSQDNIIRFNQKIKKLNIEEKLYALGAKKTDTFFIYGIEVQLDD